MTELKMGDIELKVILELHDKWLKDNGGKCANLRGADLEGADLRGAYLRSTDLRSAYLWGANLVGADLWGADLSDANYIKIIGSRHELQYCGGIVLIGCIKHTIDEWIEQYEVIGKENDYTEKEIKEYGVYLRMINDSFSHCAGRE